MVLSLGETVAQGLGLGGGLPWGFGVLPARGGAPERQGEALRVKNAVYCAVIFPEFLKSWLPSPEHMLCLAFLVGYFKGGVWPSCPQASGPSILNFLPWTIRALSGLGWEPGCRLLFMFGGSGRGGLFNLFLMNVFWRTCCNMYKGNLYSVLIFFPPFICGAGPKKVINRWGSGQGVFSLVRT